MQIARMKLGVTGFRWIDYSSANKENTSKLTVEYFLTSIILHSLRAGSDRSELQSLKTCRKPLMERLLVYRTFTGYTIEMVLINGISIIVENALDATYFLI